MDAETERMLKEHLERSLGRPVSDAEWAELTGAARLPAAEPPRPGRARRFFGGVGTVIAFIVGPLLVGTVIYGLLLGLLWAYHPSGLEDEDESFVVGAWFTGFLVIGAAQAYPTATAIIGGLCLGIGGIALGIGALIQLAG